MSTAPEVMQDNTPDESPGQGTSSPANIDSAGGAPTQPDNWKGNKDYFQSGSKAGTMKPRATRAGKPEAFAGLDYDSLASTETENNGNVQSPPGVDKKALKAEKKLVEAKVAAKFVMRILDTLTGWISKGTYGADFTDMQRKERNKYRAELEEDWEAYLITLDIPMHPALVAIFGSVLYIAPALETKEGQARTQSFREKVISKIAVGIFGGKK